MWCSPPTVITLCLLELPGFAESTFRSGFGRPVTTPQGMIGFDDGRRFRRSGSRMRSHLVNALREPIGADNTRTDFALAA